MHIGVMVPPIDDVENHRGSGVRRLRIAISRPPSRYWTASIS
jgi:hypothetical protein